MKKFQIIILLFFLVFFGFFLIGESTADEIIFRSDIDTYCSLLGCGPMDVSVQGNYAYVVSFLNDRLEIFNVSNPDSITLEGFIDTGLLSHNRSISVHGDYAYVLSEGNNRLTIFDISNPSSIVAKDNIGAGSRSIFVSYPYAYVVGGYHLTIFDISNPDSIVAKDSIDTEFGQGQINRYPSDVYVLEDYAYVTSYRGRLLIFDISNPDFIVHKSHIDANLSSSKSLFVSYPYAYVVGKRDSWYYRLAIFDISNPGSIVAKGCTNDSLSNPSFIYVQGDYAYITSEGNDRLVIFDISNPDSIVSKCYTTTNLNSPAGLFVKGKYVYVTSYFNHRFVIFEHPQAQIPVPTVGIKANGSDGPITIDYNTSADLTWTSENAVSCSASGDWSGSKSLSGSESTGNITSSKTYTITCTGPGGSANDSVTVNVAAAPSFHNVFGWAWSENIGWISFNCNNSELPEPRCVTDYGVDIDEVTGDFSGYAWSENVGWISFKQTDLISCPNAPCKATVDLFTGKVFGWAKVLCSDSWIRLRDTDYEVNIDKLTGEFHGWAWSDDYGWISFNCAEGGDCGDVDYKVITTVPFLSRPHIDNLGFSPNYCLDVKGKGYISLSWTYRNDGGDDQAEYNLQVAANSAKNPDGTFTNPLVNFEDINQVVHQDEVGSSRVDVALSPSGPQNISYNDHYYWQVQVEDAVGVVSIWTEGPEFDTPLHPYPYPDFTLTPEHPSIGEEIQLCSTLGDDCLIDVSVCYNAAGGEISCTGNIFNWTIPGATFTDGDASSENPKIEFDMIGDDQLITLRITNGVGFCAREKPFDIGLPLPNWKEIIPF